MRWPALIVWLVTAGVGLSMLVIWLDRGALRRAREGVNRIRPELVFSHVGMAVLGLVLFIVAMLTTSGLLAWLAFVVIVGVGTLGSITFYVWQKRRLGLLRATATTLDLPARALRAEEIPPEQHFPVSVVVLHGVLAIATVVLVLLVALGAGGGIDGPDEPAASPRGAGETIVGLGKSTGCVAANRPVTFDLRVKGLRRRRLPSGRKVRIEVRRVVFLVDGGRGRVVDSVRPFRTQFTMRLRRGTTHTASARITYLQGDSPQRRQRTVVKMVRACA